MVVGAEQKLQALLGSDPAAAAEWAETQKLTTDPRVTGIGAVLRRTSLDELPQLLNVLHGDMSLVGPRPITDAEVERYADDIASYIAVRPGVTGLWQVSGRSETTYARRIQLDVRYVKSWSLLQDVSILLRTIPAVLLRRGAV
jgi:undecaprenyl-phosphate galactose phosphotransferase